MYWIHSRRKRRARPKQTVLADRQVKRGLLDWSIPSAVWDKACTSHTGRVGYPFIQTEQRSNKIFALADGHPIPATNIANLEQREREPV